MAEELTNESTQSGGKSVDAGETLDIVDAVWHRVQTWASQINC